MNKRYIDFVPVKKTMSPQQWRELAKKPSQGATVQPKARAVQNRVSTRRMPAEEVTKPALGVIEDLNSSFVKTEVPKRPLGQKEAAPGDDLAKAKAQKVKKAKITSVKPVEKPVKKSTKTAKPDDSKVFRPPVATFINQEKVVKRPLSRNVYQKPQAAAKVTLPKETAKPVTIIAKKEKDTSISIVVTIIITIILGAVAGTVAFLLLPK